MSQIKLQNLDDLVVTVTPAQARQWLELNAALLRDKPERSDRTTARIAKVDHKTVAIVRADLRTNGEIPHCADRTDANGKKAPGRKPDATAVRRGPKPWPGFKPPPASQRLRQITIPMSGAQAATRIFRTWGAEFCRELAEALQKRLSRAAP